MILPVVAYGDPVLREEAEDIDKDYPNLAQLIDNMFETMDEAKGVGLAAPQVGLAIRLFIIDTTPFEDDETPAFKEVFINPEILDETGEPWEYEEGCLSIPNIRENVSREPKVKIQYYDREFNFHEKEFDGMIARVIQHEYDHIEGILFVDYLSPLKKTFLRGKLNDIAKGKISVDYKMRFPKLKRR